MTIRAGMVLICAAVAIGSLHSPLPANTPNDWPPNTYWTGSSGNWFTEANWSAGVPHDELEAIVENFATLSITSGVAENYRLWLGTDTYHTGNPTGGSLDISGGTLTTEVGIRAAQEVNSESTIRLHGTGKIHSTSGGLNVGVCGRAAMFQTSSSSTVDVRWLGVGSSEDVCSYTLDAGTVITNSLYVGGMDTIFRQNSGSVTIDRGYGWIDAAPGGSARYELVGGDLLAEHPGSSAEVYVGMDGEGAFIHTGGTHTFRGFLILGRFEDSFGTYEISGSSVLEADRLRVGDWGGGLFEQTGGTVNVQGDIEIGYNTPYADHNGRGDGEYRLLNGSLSANQIEVGVYADGKMAIRNATCEVNWGVSVGAGDESTGELTIGSAGWLSCDELYVGGGQFALVTQTDGFVQAEFGVTVDSWGGQAEYVLEFGELQTSNLWVGFSYSGTFTQQDGTVELTGGLVVGGEFNDDAVYCQEGGTVDATQAVAIGAGMDGLGRYELLAGAELTTAELVVGGLGSGELTISGATCLAGHLAVGRDFITHSDPYTWMGDGTVTMDQGAILECDTTTVGDAGIGTIVNGDALHEVDDLLVLGNQPNSSGTYVLHAGRLQAGRLVVGFEGHGELQIVNPAGEIELIELLRFGPDSTLTAADGRIVLAGVASSFDLETTDAAALADLANIELVIETGAGGLSTIEAASLRDGGFAENFAIGTLALGGLSAPGHAALVDHHDNGQWGTPTPECVFIGELMMDEDSSLDVNGIRLYLNGDMQDWAEMLIADGAALRRQRPRAGGGLRRGEPLDAHCARAGDGAAHARRKCPPDAATTEEPAPLPTIEGCGDQSPGIPNRSRARKSGSRRSGSRKSSSIRSARQANNLACFQDLHAPMTSPDASAREKTGTSSVMFVN